ncbi:hypothetical protein [Flavobacterium sp. 14A]|uniref:hypothetical protein n=1 Tax=Flavobacterium sp. 14A TaxID=2735896 RepID=UPI00156DD394|nr:hypothetical protein [Flavobacterium sp. 14A]NRT10765.1 putative membrane protein [Flavobacterium sp. 14A]
MLQILLNTTTTAIKYIVWVSLVIVAIPLMIYSFLNLYFYEFTMEMGFGFWILFSVLTVIGFVVLLKPIFWILEGIETLVELVLNKAQNNNPTESCICK